MSKKYFNFANEAAILEIDVNDETGVVTFEIDGDVAEYESVQAFAEFFATAGRNVTPENLKNWVLVENGEYISFVLRAATAGLDTDSLAKLAQTLKDVGASDDLIIEFLTKMVDEQEDEYDLEAEAYETIKEFVSCHPFADQIFEIQNPFDDDDYYTTEEAWDLMETTYHTIVGELLEDYPNTTLEVALACYNADFSLLKECDFKPLFIAAALSSRPGVVFVKIDDDGDFYNIDKRLFTLSDIDSLSKTHKAVSSEKQNYLVPR